MMSQSEIRLLERKAARLARAEELLWQTRDDIATASLLQDVDAFLLGTTKRADPTPAAWRVTTASGFCRFYAREFEDVARMDAARFTSEPATVTPLYTKEKR